MCKKNNSEDTPFGLCKEADAGTGGVGKRRLSAVERCNAKLDEEDAEEVEPRRANLRADADALADFPTLPLLDTDSLLPLALLPSC